ncbi:MAG TPA: response regulator [Pedobacter sp.]|uniref:response regulator n=1 Tax=Pedobacter sp. TaxID=1411316 RepID=UPI002BEFF9BB|nr:response regulator [Pedobacter sp.]HMI02123.1 response regulator [Pedobacter sp.]
MIEETKHLFERVMVIDDNEIDLFITSHIAEKNNFGKNIMKYLEPEKALKYLQDNQENLAVLPEVIFLDIHMPIITGFQFMKAYDTLSHILKNNCRIFVISSTCDDNDLMLLQNEKNMAVFQEKPITKEFLKSIVP